MPEVPRKRCPKCHATFEGEGVSTLYSCDQCGNGYLSSMPPIVTEGDADTAPLPRAGGGGNITHTREDY